MTGSFGGGLEARDVPAGDGRLTSAAVGDIELDGKVMVIARIEITYHLRVDEDVDRDAIDRAFRNHPPRCPVYRSIHPQIDVTTELELSALTSARCGQGRDPSRRPAVPRRTGA